MQEEGKVRDNLAYSPEEYFAAREKKKFGRKKKKKKMERLPRSDSEGEGDGTEDHWSMRLQQKGAHQGKEENSEGEQDSN